MSGLIDWHGNSDDPVPVAEDCPECGSSDTLTSAFSARNPGEPEWHSAWCEACGHGFGTDALAGEGSA